MKAIYWRELKKHFRSVTGLVFLALSLLVTGVCFVSFQLVLGGADLDDSAPIILYGMALLMPLLGWQIFGNEGDRKDDWLQSLPVSRTVQIAGKLLAALTVLVLANGSMLLYPPVLSMLSKVSMGEAYSQIFLLFLCELTLFCLVCFLFALCKRRWVATLISYGVMALWMALGVFVVLLPNESVTEAIQGLSVFYMMEDIRYGLLDWSSILFLLAASALLFAGTLAFLCREGKRGAKPAFGSKQALCTVLAVLLVGTGALTCLLPTKVSQLDVTSSGKYTLSADTKQLLRDLDEDITLYHLVNAASDSAYERYWRRICQENPHLTYQNLPIDQAEEWLAERGLSLVAAADGVVMESAKRCLYLPFSDLFTYTNELLGVEGVSYSEYYNLGMQYYANYLNSGTEQAYYYYVAWEMGIQKNLRGDYMIASTLAYVTAETVPTLYYLTGHGEPNLSETALWSGCLQNFALPVLEQFVTPVKEWSPRSGAISADASALVINKPTADLTEEELTAILSYAEQGGKILLLTDSDFLSLPNFNRLTAEYGMTAEAGPVMIEETVKNEDGTERKQETSTVTGTVDYDHEALSVYANATSRFPTLTDADSILLAEETETADLLLTSLLTSPAESYRAGAADEKGSYVLAAAAERPNGMKLVWVTGAEALNDSTALTQNQSLFLTYLLSWCRESYQNPVAEGESVPFTEANRSVTATPMIVCGVLFCFLLPAGVLVTGLCIRFIRRRRLPNAERIGEES